jgi:hypothetical protein
MTEKEIFVDYGNGVGTNLVYSLSNDIAEVEMAIKTRAKVNFSLDNVNWTLNSVLSESVKELMIDNDVNFSMAIPSTVDGRYIIINKRNGDEWFSYVIEPEKYRQMLKKLVQDRCLKFLADEGYIGSLFNNDFYISFKFEGGLYLI